MVEIRQARVEDADAIAAMTRNFNKEEGGAGRIETVQIHELCFSDRPFYRALVADDGATLVGYALIMPYFDMMPCAWCSYMEDLYVIPMRRNQGIGWLLIAAVAKMAVAEGLNNLYWHALPANTGARRFYASTGAVEGTAIPLALAGDALRTLAAEAA
ncbi:MAG: GNAT family N-acetyltransferase [Geminicoccaceae bacterium]